MAGKGLDEDRLMTLLAAWDDVSSAIDRIILAQPSQMTAAAERLAIERSTMRAVINHVCRPGDKP